MALLVLAVLAATVGFGIYQGLVGRSGLDPRAGIAVLLVWCLALIVVAFDDERAKKMGVAGTWAAAIFIDVAVVASVLYLAGA